jgi:hypothetical protein
MRNALPRFWPNKRQITARHGEKQWFNLKNDFGMGKTIKKEGMKRFVVNICSALWTTRYQIEMNK